MRHTSVPNSKKYAIGLKRCSWCEVFLSTEEIRCPCCRMILRTKSRNKRKFYSDSKTDDTNRNFSVAWNYS